MRGRGRSMDGRVTRSYRSPAVRCRKPSVTSACSSASVSSRPTCHSRCACSTVSRRLGRSSNSRRIRSSRPASMCASCVSLACLDRAARLPALGGDADEVLHFGEQPRRCTRLEQADVGIGRLAAVGRSGPRARPRTGGEHDERNVAAPRSTPQVPAERQAVDARNVEVRHDRIRREHGDQLERLYAVLRFRHTEARTPQRLGILHAQRTIVLHEHDERCLARDGRIDGGCHGSPPGGTDAASSGVEGPEYRNRSRRWQADLRVDGAARELQR